MKVAIVDFEDSFTFNIASEVSSMGHTCEVYNWKMITTASQFKSYDWVIFGPGPGHPEEYSDIFSVIRELDNDKNVKLMGICLGHQILGLLKGFTVVKCLRPVHGMTQKIKIPNWNHLFSQGTRGKNVTVQKYNSLTLRPRVLENQKVKVLVEDNEICMLGFNNGISYQFHPESIGTSFPSYYFEALDLLRYNE